MKKIKLVVSALSLLIVNFAYAKIVTCCAQDLNDGKTYCVVVEWAESCTDDEFLDAMSEIVPQGWTCSETGRGVFNKDKKAFIGREASGNFYISTEKTKIIILSDKSKNAIKDLTKLYKANKIDTQEFKKNIFRIFKTNKGVVSKKRLNRIAQTLNLKIKYKPN